MLLWFLAAAAASVASTAADRTGFSTALSGNSSYLTLPAWQPCPSASLEFEFRTASHSALLLYAELREPGANLSRKAAMFLHARLAKGRLKVSLRLSPAEASGGLPLHRPDIVSLGSFAKAAGGAGKFARVGIRVGDGFVRVDFGNRTETLRTAGSRRPPRVWAAASPVHFGGLPPQLRVDATQRTVFMAAFEKALQGQLRNIVYADCPDAETAAASTSMSNRVARAPQPLSSAGAGILQHPAACSGDPCRNGGVCLAVDDPDDRRCRCQEEFDGGRCENHAALLTERPVGWRKGEKAAG